MKKILIFACVLAAGLTLPGTGCRNRARQEAEVQRLQAELRNTKDALEKTRSNQLDLEAGMKSATQARDQLAEQVNQLTTARDRLQQTLTEVGASRDQSRQELAEMTSSRDRLQKQVDEITAARKLLQEELDTATRSRDAAVAEAQKAQKRIDELTSQLQAEMKKAQELQGQIASANQARSGAEAMSVETLESPSIHSFATTRPKISAGQNSTLSWRVSNATRVRIEPDIGPVGALGSRIVSPTKTTTYILIAINEAGESRVTRRIEVF
jgi:myosin heavy subunit